MANAREGGGIGRRVRLRGVWLSVWVQVPSFTPNESIFGRNRAESALFLCFLKAKNRLFRDFWVVFWVVTVLVRYYLFCFSLLIFHCEMSVDVRCDVASRQMPSPKIDKFIFNTAHARSTSKRVT